MARQATRLRAQCPLPGTRLSFACAVGAAATVAPYLSTDSRGRSPEPLCDLPHRLTGRTATGEEWIISFPVRFNDINDLARPGLKMPVLGPMSYDFGLGDEGSPPADRRQDRARDGCAVGGSIGTRLAARLVITRAEELGAASSGHSRRTGRRTSSTWSRDMAIAAERFRTQGCSSHPISH